jgi:hypothetical protein
MSHTLLNMQIKPTPNVVHPRNGGLTSNGFGQVIGSTGREARARMISYRNMWHPVNADFLFLNFQFLLSACRAQAGV